MGQNEYLRDLLYDIAAFRSGFDNCMIRSSLAWTVGSGETRTY